MTIKYLAANEIQGLSSDTKPILVPTNSTFFEIDTQSNYYFNGSSWVLITLTGSGSNVNYGSYTIYIDTTNSAVKAKNNFTGAITSTASAPATSTDTRILLNNVFTALQVTGGAVFIKNGTYFIDGLTSALRIGSASFPRSFVRFTGETMNGAIIKADPGTGALWPSQSVVSMYCDCFIENMTIDGNGVAHFCTACAEPVFYWMDRCRFKGVLGQTYGGIHVWGSGTLGHKITNCWWDTGGSLFGDCLAMGGSQNYIICDGCYFDTGFYGPSSGGNSTNLQFTNNVIKMPVTNSGRNDGGLAISLEVDDVGTHGYTNVLISGNTIMNSGIAVGRQGVWDAAARVRNVVITGNTIYGAGLRLLGPPTGSYTAKMTNILVTGNTFEDCGQFGIDAEKCDGPLVIRNNIFKNSNTAHDATQNSFAGPIYLDTCNYVNIESNTIWMDDTLTNANPFAIKTVGTGMSNLRLVDNYIRNATSNTALVLSGSYGTTINRGNDIV